MLKRVFHKRLKLILSLLILVVIGIVVAIFIGYRRIQDQPDILLSSFKKDAEFSLDGVRQTSTRDGAKEWELDAVSAEFNNENKKALLKGLSVIFFLKNGKKVAVTAARGILNADSNNIEASGDVVVSYEQIRLNTENLLYQHQQRVISSQTPVEIIGDTFVLKADTLSYDLNTNIASLKGGVEGTFVEKFKL